MITFGLIFAMGSDMDEYYCKFETASLEAAQIMGSRAYPGRWVHVLPWDARFEAHVRVYEKTEIPLGFYKELRPPNDPESLHRSGPADPLSPSGVETE